MAETTKKPGAYGKKSSGAFPMWIIAFIVGLALGIIVAKMMGGGGSTGNFGMVKDVDSTDKGQWSYANGFAIGTDIKASTAQLDEETSVDEAIVAQAIADVLLDRDVKLTEEQVQEIYKARSEVAQASQEKKAAENTGKGTEFLNSFAAQSGVQKTATGTAYKVITEGDGATVGKQVALVNYVGKHIDGTEFDSSEKNGGQPVPFASEGVIPGLGPVLELMKVGDKYEIVVPAELAYAAQGVQGVIEPNETLIFEIEVAGIQESQVAPAASAADEEGEEDDEATTEDN